MKFSVVIPLKNEEHNITELIHELEEVMNRMNAVWELICINDGSTDKTQAVLNHLAKEKPFLKVIKFKKNYGQSSAFQAGFLASKGEFVITLDGDRQNDPKDIPMMAQMITDCDLVCGIRKKRKDPFSKRIISKLANRIRNWICQDGVADTGCSLKVYRRSCLLKIKMYHGMHRFLPALFTIEGFKVREIPVNHRERVSGKSNYNFFNRSFNTIADLLVVAWMKRRQLNYQIEEK